MAMVLMTGYSVINMSNTITPAFTYGKTERLR
jgi:hypothetical protein